MNINNSINKILGTSAPRRRATKKRTIRRDCRSRNMKQQTGLTPIRGKKPIRVGSKIVVTRVGPNMVDENEKIIVRNKTPLTVTKIWKMGPDNAPSSNYDVEVAEVPMEFNSKYFKVVRY